MYFVFKRFGETGAEVSYSVVNLLCIRDAKVTDQGDRLSITYDNPQSDINTVNIKNCINVQQFFNELSLLNRSVLNS